MIQEYQLRVLPEVAANEQRIKEYLIQEKGVSARDITATRILKRSIACLSQRVAEREGVSGNRL